MPSSPSASAGATVNDPLSRARALHEAGRLVEARSLYEHWLSLAPRDFDALHLRGVLALQEGRMAEALAWLDRAIEVRANVAVAHNHRGVALRELGRQQAALAAFEAALSREPHYIEALRNRALLLQAQGRLQDALAGFDAALVQNPADVRCLNDRGIVLVRLDQPDEALACFERVLALQPEHLQACNNRGNVLRSLDRPAEAIDCYDHVLARQPGHADAWNNRGNALKDLGRAEEALECFDAAIERRPRFAAAYNNRGIVLRLLWRLEEAVASYDQALALQPGYVHALCNRGNALLALERADEALDSFDRALAIDPRDPQSHAQRGHALKALGRMGEAAECYDAAMRLDPDQEDLLGTWLNARMRICRWDGLTGHLARLARGIARGSAVTTPFPVLALLDSPPIQLRAARLHAARRHERSRPAPRFERGPADGRIRVGYFSADFHEHATAYLLAECLESHDADGFEIHGFSFGPSRCDTMRRRIERACHSFTDVRRMADGQVARIARERGLDIAVDLKGYTQDSRAGIFAERCAPIQASYLGYPGSMGAPFIDYLIADRIVVPPGQRSDIDEKVVYLPGCYQANDSSRSFAPATVSRPEAGLPDRAFVYCCFNNSYKILPDMFAAWVRILQQVDGSVLWMLEDNPDAVRNLRREAAARGLDPARLVFAPRRPHGEHLARHQLADLFLDTVPCNAHTTASDALWAGLPLLTLAGRSFAARVAASLLGALGLPELVVATPAEYEATAVALARDPARLAALRQRLGDARCSTRLFDGRALARDLESAYRAMVARQRAGRPPAPIDLHAARD